jgi:hypothetical protein
MEKTLYIIQAIHVSYLAPCTVVWWRSIMSGRILRTQLFGGYEKDHRWGNWGDTMISSYHHWFPQQTEFQLSGPS